MLLEADNMTMEGQFRRLEAAFEQHRLQHQGEVERLALRLTEQVRVSELLAERVAELERRLADVDEHQHQNEHQQEHEYQHQNEHQHDHEYQHQNEHQHLHEHQHEDRDGGVGGNDDDDDDDAAGGAAALANPASTILTCSFPGCFFIYQSQEALGKHVRDTHNSDPAGRKAHVCRVCGASYAKKTGLSRHVGKHAPGARAEQVELRRPQPGGCPCPLCNRVFGSRLNRYDHLSRRHPNWRQQLPNFQR